MAAREAVSSCGPQPKDQPPPPMAQAPKPMVVIFNSLVPRKRVGNVMMSPPFGFNVYSSPRQKLLVSIWFDGNRWPHSMTLFTQVSAVSDTPLGHCSLAGVGPCSARSDFLRSSSHSLRGLVGGQGRTLFSRSYASCSGLK